MVPLQGHKVIFSPSSLMSIILKIKLLITEISVSYGQSSHSYSITKSPTENLRYSSSSWSFSVQQSQCFSSSRVPAAIFSTLSRNPISAISCPSRDGSVSWLSLRTNRAPSGALIFLQSYHFSHKKYFIITHIINQKSKRTL